MIIVWNNKVYSLDEETIHRWAGTTEKLRTFLDSVHDVMRRNEKVLLSRNHVISEVTLARAVVTPEVMQVYMRCMTAVLEDLQSLMGKRDFDKCFRKKIKLTQIGNVIHEDGQGAYDLDNRKEIPCPTCTVMQVK